jgi:hypothetical protein
VSKYANDQLGLICELCFFAIHFQLPLQGALKDALRSGKASAKKFSGSVSRAYQAIADVGFRAKK